LFCFVFLFYLKPRSLNLLKESCARHSAGCLTAVNSYFEAPERIAALILVAPAILAPLTVHKVVEGKQLGRENQMEEDSLDLTSLRNSFLRLSKILLKCFKFVAQAIMRMVKGMAVMLNSLYKKLLSAILRSALAVMLVMDFFPDDFTL
jgi:pimeloyl-ACP methyl ester carboxylesterase